MSEVTEIVSRGATMLDEHRPGWARKINTDRLNICSSDNCVLGQLNVNHVWDDELQMLPDYVRHHPGEFGFVVGKADTVVDQQMPGWIGSAGRGALTVRFTTIASAAEFKEAWTKEVERRLDKDLRTRLKLALRDRFIEEPILTSV